jgi:tetratricopeptide (TPR) repeat protein
VSLILRDRGAPIPDLEEGYPDFALLAVDIREHPCVLVDEELPTFNDSFQAYGFPKEGGSVVPTPVLLSYRGLKGHSAAPYLDLAADKVKPGMSGAALLNLRTGGVCGILVATRGEYSTDGGFAVPWSAVAPDLADVLEANRARMAGDSNWATASRPARRRVRFGIPAVTAHYQGRSVEGQLLEQALGETGRAVITQSISGLGGIGKTQLAARYVHDHADEYDVVAWVGAEDGGVSDLAALATELGLEVGGVPPEERAQRVVRWMARSAERWLLVLDNVTSLADLNAHRPTTGNGRILVTSRHQGLDQFGAVLRLDVFDEDTGSHYLRVRAPRAGDDGAARRLSNALGHLPLALSHAGAYCAAGAVTFDGYHSMLSDLPATELFDSSPESFYEQTVGSTWQPSIKAATQKTPVAPAVLMMAAYLAPDGIPIALLGILMDDESASSRKRLGDAVNALHDLSLIEVADDALNVHRLLQKVMRDDAAERDDLSGMRSALAALAESFPADVELPANWPECEALLPHIIALGNAARGQPASEILLLLHRACGYLLAADSGARAVTTAETAVALARQHLDPDEPIRISLMSDLAYAYWSAGRTNEAISIEELVVADTERLLGPDHFNTLIARGNLATSYRSAGRTAEAIALLEQLVPDAERLLGRDHPGSLKLRGNLATCYSAAGRTAEAIALREENFADVERLLGPDHPDTVTSRGNLATSYSAAGRTAEAIALREENFAAAVRLLGANHPGTLAARGNLATSYHAAGRTNEAMTLFEELLADAKRLLGPDHPDTLTARGNLATSYRTAGRTTEAIALLEQLVADRERLLGPDHPDTLTARGNLATSYPAAGQTTEAITLLEQLVADSERVLGPNHPATLTTHGNLAASYQAAGRTSLAVDLLEQLVADAERVLGPDHPATLTTRGNLAASYWSQERTAEAVDLMQKVVLDSERSLGAGHPNTLAASAALDSWRDE